MSAAVASISAQKPTVALNFDGVLHSYTSGWTGYVPKDPPVEGAVAFVEGLLDRGYSVVIYSTRFEEGTGRSGAYTWLNEHGFPTASLPMAVLKPKAVLYVDDRGYRFDGDFDSVLDYVDTEGPQCAPWYQDQEGEEEENAVEVAGTPGGSEASSEGLDGVGPADREQVEQAPAAGAAPGDGSVGD